MFNLNEGSRIVIAQHPTDMRMGVNGMCGQVGKVGLDPSNGDVYIFVGKSRTTMKLLHWERGGYVMLLQTFGARPFPSSHISLSGHRLLIYALG